MPITKHEIPLLEFDSDPSAVIMPTHEGLDIQLPPKCVYAFLEDEIEAFALDHQGKKIAEFVSATKVYPVYLLTYKEQDICLAQAPVGSAPAAQFMDWLIGYGVKEIMSTGTCGVLVPIEENRFLVPTKALREEGTSYHYVAPSRYIAINPIMLRLIEQTLLANGLAYQEVITWSTDGFYRETKEKVAYRREEGCSVVEMECSALAAVAQLRKVLWGQLLFTADTLADIEAYDQRNWGADSFTFTLNLCLEVLHTLDKAEQPTDF